MFSNPLKQAAEGYLYTDDNSERERSKQQLIRAGSSAVAPLIDGLIVTLRKLNSASWGKKEVQGFTDAVEQYLGDEFAEMLRQQNRDMPDREGDGMSMAQVMFSREAATRTWQVVSQIGESAIRALFTLVNGRDKHIRLAALLALSAEDDPSRLVLNLLNASAPYRAPLSEDPVESMAQWLIVGTLGLGGDRQAGEMIDKFCRLENITENEFYEGAVGQGIYLIAKSR